MAVVQVSQGPAAMDNAIPELSNVDYVLNVLQLPEDQVEDQVEDELVAKADALGISTDTNEKRNTSSLESSSTVATYHARTFSILSNGSVSTALTTHSSLFGPPAPELSPSSKNINAGRGPKDLSFSQYDRYLKLIDPHHDHSSYAKKTRPSEDADATSQSLFTIKSRKTLFGVKSGLKSRIRWRKKAHHPPEAAISCVNCRNDLKKPPSLHPLPCGHTYCGDCLNAMVDQAISDESRMPPRCCAQPLPGAVIKGVVDLDGQQQFLKAVTQYSTPWEARIFCPNASCGEFIPPRHRPDPKHPFNVTCRKCSTRACVVCKRGAHPTGKDCPDDWELEEVLRTAAQESGWKRCHKCRNLVELTQGSTHMSCRCKAQFCCICGAIWDPNIGCPNLCDGEDELERRKIEEEAAIAAYEAERAARMAAAAEASAERLEAEKRSQSHSEFQALLQSQEEDIRRFRRFRAKARSDMKRRHGEEQQALLQRQKDQGEETEVQHAKSTADLEDRQVAAEMELRATLEASERSVKIRLRHMEAYCDSLGRNAKPGADGRMPARTVTERDLRELDQQYNLRDGMERSHQAKINVMRDRQARRMEELQDRQEAEMAKLFETQQQERDDQVARFASEEDALEGAFAERRARLVKRWELAMEILQKELEAKHGVKYAVLPTPEWREENETIPAEK